MCLQDPDLPCSGHRQLLVLCGMDTDANPINDLWMLDIDQMEWRQVSISTAMNALTYHLVPCFYNKVQCMALEKPQNFPYSGETT